MVEGDEKMNLAKVEFTYNEDMLIVRHLDAETETSPLPWPLFHSRYLEHHKAHPALFPRSFPRAFDFVSRLVELKLGGPGKTPSARYVLIRRDLDGQRESLAKHVGDGSSSDEDEDQDEDQDEDGIDVVEAGESGKRGEDEDGEEEGGKKKRKKRKSVRWGKTHTPRMQIGLAMRGRGVKTLMMKREPLVQASRVIADAVEGFVPTPEVHMPQLQFSDVGEAFDDEPSYKMFTPEVFSKFVTWAGSPGILKEEHKVSAKLEKVTADFADLRKRLGEENTRAREYRRSQIEALREKEEKRIRSVLDAQFERDVRALRAQHEVFVRMELTKLGTKYERVLSEVDTFYETQDVQVQMAADDLASRQVTQLVAEADRVRAVTSRIFESRSLLSLTLLAEHLEAEEMKLDCVTEIARTFHVHMASPELASKHLSDTTRCRILSALPDRVLVGTLGAVESKLEWSSVPGLLKRHRDVVQFFGKLVARQEQYSETSLRTRLVLREFKLRVLQVEQALSELPLLALKRNMNQARESSTSKYGPWLELLSHELGARHAVNPTLSLTSGVSSPHAVLDGLVARVSHPRKYVLVQAAMKPKTESHLGACFFEVTLLACPHESALGSVAVGFDVPRSVLSSAIPGVTPEPLFVQSNLEHQAAGEGSLTTEVHGFSWQSDGYLHAGGRSVYIGHGFGEGDVIGVGLDMTEGVLYFYCNGVSLQKQHAAAVASKGGDSSESGLNTLLRITTTSFSLVPAVSMYASVDAAAVGVEYNFAGPFVTKVPDHFDQLEFDQRERA